MKPAVEIIKTGVGAGSKLGIAQVRINGKLTLRYIKDLKNQKP